MVVVIKKLTHPYSLTHKNYKQKYMEFFFLCVGFRERERERETFSEFLKVFFFIIFLLFYDFPQFFLPISLFFTCFLSIFFSKRGEGVFIGEMRKWEASISVTCYTCASHPWQGASLFMISGLIFVQLFGGLSKLRFLQTLNSRKTLDV